MKHPRNKTNSWWFIRIILCKLKGQLKSTWKNNIYWYLTRIKSIYSSCFSRLYAKGIHFNCTNHTSIPRCIIRTAGSMKQIRIKTRRDKPVATIKSKCFYPKITAFQSKILLSWGAPLIPAGGSCCNLLKSLISLFLAAVDIFSRCLQKHKDATSQKQN